MCVCERKWGFETRLGITCDQDMKLVLPLHLQPRRWFGWLCEFILGKVWLTMTMRRVKFMSVFYWQCENKGMAYNRECSRCVLNREVYGCWVILEAVLNLSKREREREKAWMWIRRKGRERGKFYGSCGRNKKGIPYFHLCGIVYIFIRLVWIYSLFAIIHPRLNTLVFWTVYRELFRLSSLNILF